MDLKSTYNKIAEDWFGFHKRDTWWKEGIDKFMEILPSGASVLDVGCGAGVDSKYLAENGFRPSGLDFSEKMIEIAKRESPEIPFEVFDIYNIDTYPGTFDGLLAKAVLLHIPKSRISEVLGKLKDRINPAGIMYVAVKGIRENGLQEELKQEDELGYEYERFFSYYTMEELEKYFTDLGMKVVWKTNIRTGRADWLQIIAKK